MITVPLYEGDLPFSNPCTNFLSFFVAIFVVSLKCTDPCSPVVGRSHSKQFKEDGALASSNFKVNQNVSSCEQSVRVSLECYSMCECLCVAVLSIYTPFKN